MAQHPVGPSPTTSKAIKNLQVVMCMQYMVRCDDGVLAGNRKPVLRAIHLTEELGTALGLHINLTKCELFSSKGNTSFPPAAKISLLPNLDILGTSGGLLAPL